jgi:mRNA interferase RelE/StbE
VRTAYRKRFLKDLARLPGPVRVQVERFAFETMPQATTLGATGRVEKLKGFPGAYKARFGAYRVGMLVEDEVVVFARVLDRKEIYRYFP